MKPSPFCPELIFVEGGTFLMGSDAKPVEQPVIQVTLPSFWIGKHLVTFDEFDYFCTETGREKPADQEDEREGYAVRTVSWLDAEAYVRWLSETLDQPIRLPSEAEWEFAARGGNLTKGFRYAGSDKLEEVGWFGENSGIQWPRVGQLKPNELGIFDMSGLSSEFCQDEWQNRHSSNPRDGRPLILGKSTKKVLKNAGWIIAKHFSCEVTRRYGISQKVQASNYSFRIAMSC